MPLKIIGAGLGRTGTLTLKTALEQLGFGPCHHMLEVMAHPEQIAFWNRAAAGEEVAWNAVMDAYESTTDWPSCHYWRELAAHSPEARIILTLRDPEIWFESMNGTILKVLEMSRGAGPGPLDAIRFVQRIVAEQTFADDFSRANAIAAYERHNASVREAIPPDRLLVYRVSEGWEPLCAFLGVPVPDAPFPRTNSREEFWTHAPPSRDAAAQGT